MFSYKYTMLNELSKRIKDQALQHYFPPIIWLIQNFEGDLIDEYGIPINADDYLEEALENQEGFSKDVLELNKIRTLYKTLFTQRHCFILSELSQFEELIFDLVNPKMINGAVISGRALIGLVERVVAMLNKSMVIH